VILIAGILALAILLLSLGRQDTVAGTGAVIRSMGGKDLLLDLRVSRTLEVEGPLGVTRIVVENGGVRVAESPCPHRLCIRKGLITRTGDLTACLPNGVVVTITGESEYDGITP
jgi:hypothetical protein